MDKSLLLQDFRLLSHHPNSDVLEVWRYNKDLLQYKKTAFHPI